VARSAAEDSIRSRHCKQDCKCSIKAATELLSNDPFRYASMDVSLQVVKDFGMILPLFPAFLPHHAGVA